MLSVSRRGIARPALTYVDVPPVANSPIICLTPLAGNQVPDERFVTLGASQPGQNTRVYSRTPGRRREIATIGCNAFT